MQEGVNPPSSYQNFGFEIHRHKKVRKTWLLLSASEKLANVKVSHFSYLVELAGLSLLFPCTSFDKLVPYSNVALNLRARSAVQHDGHEKRCPQTGADCCGSCRKNKGLLLVPTFNTFPSSDMVDTPQSMYRLCLGQYGMSE